MSDIDEGERAGEENAAYDAPPQAAEPAAVVDEEQRFRDELAARYRRGGFTPEQSLYLAEQDVHRINDAEEARLKRAEGDGRERFLARISDVIRRSGVEDGDRLILEAEIQTLRGNPDRVTCFGHPECVVTKAGSSVELLCPRGLALMRRGLT